MNIFNNGAVDFEIFKSYIQKYESKLFKKIPQNE